MLSSDASFAFPYYQAENKDALAPNPASKLLSFYQKELEILSGDVTPIGAKDTQKLQERWDAVYRGNDKSFQEFVRALRVEDNWVAVTAKFFAGAMLNKLSSEEGQRADINIEDAFNELLKQIEV